MHDLNFDFDDFDMDIQPEELHAPDEFLDERFETDSTPEGFEASDYYEAFDGMQGCPFDEGSDRDNWEDQQVFLDGQNEW